tara:strand:- start:963 stop:1559 length:597 start_codon:yes stop_codon:yes gene_type:complete
MEKVTPINELSQKMGDADNDIVNNIINDLNSKHASNNQRRPPQQGPPQQGPPQQVLPQQAPPQQGPLNSPPPQQGPPQRPPQMSQEEYNFHMMEQRKRMMMEQEKILQQQNMLKSQQEEKEELPPEDIFTNIKAQSKNIIIVIILSFLLNLDVTNDIIKSLNISFLLNEAGDVNIQGLLLKSIFVGICYYLVTFFMKD